MKQGKAKGGETLYEDTTLSLSYTHTHTHAAQQYTFKLCLFGRLKPKNVLSPSSSPSPLSFALSAISNVQQILGLPRVKVFVQNADQNLSDQGFYALLMSDVWPADDVDHSVVSN